MTRATAWTAVAVAAVNTTVQVQVNARTGLDIIVDGVKEDFDDLPTQEFSGKELCLCEYVVCDTTG